MCIKGDDLGAERTRQREVAVGERDTLGRGRGRQGRQEHGRRCPPSPSPILRIRFDMVFAPIHFKSSNASPPREPIAAPRDACRCDAPSRSRPRPTSINKQALGSGTGDAGQTTAAGTGRWRRTQSTRCGTWYPGARPLTAPKLAFQRS